MISSSKKRAAENLKTGTVLIADDEAVIREMVTDKLKRAGFEVLCAYNGAEALDLVRIHLPKVVILDWVMPVLDGVATCQQIKADPHFAGIQVIILTAHGLVSDRQEIFAAGADLILVKPVSLKALVDHVRELGGAFQDGQGEQLIFHATAGGDYV